MCETFKFDLAVKTEGVDGISRPYLEPIFLPESSWKTQTKIQKFPKTNEVIWENKSQLVFFGIQNTIFKLFVQDSKLNFVGQSVDFSKNWKKVIRIQI